MTAKKISVILTAATCVFGTADIILSIIGKNYVGIAVSVLPPLVSLFILLDGVFFSENGAAAGKIEKRALYLNFGFIFTVQLVLALGSFIQTVEYAFSSALIISVAYSIAYGITHVRLFKISKKFFMSYLFVTLLILAALVSVYVFIPKEYIDIRIFGSLTIYSLSPWLFGAKFVIDLIVGLGAFPSIKN